MRKVISILLALTMCFALSACSSSTSKPSETETKTETERFAENNDVSVELTESIETVLAGMELTDKSRVGVFHYNLSDVYNWKQIEDWAEGQRYSAWMAQEHIFYFYVKDDTVVGVRDSRGNIFYLEESSEDKSEPSSSPQSVSSLTAKELYDNAESYKEQYVLVSGTVKEISAFSDMNGYYLQGTKGQGLVCWVDETSLSSSVGETVEFYGYVQSVEAEQVELIYCEKR